MGQRHTVSITKKNYAKVNIETRFTYSFYYECFGPSEVTTELKEAAQDVHFYCCYIEVLFGGYTFCQNVGPHIGKGMVQNWYL